MPDLFISFAHLDNKPFASDEKGWTTHFVNNLRNEVSRKMGRMEDYELWMDFCLKGSDEITSEIEKQLTDTHALIIVMSSAWLASQWCQRELETFSRNLTQSSGRIFVVELDRIDNEDKPPILRDLLTYRFWRETDENKVRQLGYPVPKVTDETYYDRLADLSQELVISLKNKTQTTTTKETVSKATVYIAPVNDALYEQRAIMINELGQFGIDVLPHHNLIDDNIEADLSQCSHFIQLLDAYWTMGVPYKLYAAAERIAKPIMQWRAPALDFAGVAVRAEQKKMLEGEFVIATPLSDFIRYVRQTVLPKPVITEDQPTAVQDDQTVFVHAGQVDFDRAYDVAQTLKSRGYGIVLPRYKGDASRIRKSIERGYQLCDVVLMLQENAPAEVVEDHLSEAQVQTLQRASKPPIMICQGNEAEELYFAPPGMTTLICSKQFDEHCLQQFLVECKK